MEVQASPRVVSVMYEVMRDSLFLCYGIEKTDLPYHCNNCGVAFSICHALDRKKDGLIMAHQNELSDGVANLEGKAFTPTHVHDDSKIFTGCYLRGGKTKGKTTKKGKEAPPLEEGDEKEDLMIQDIWTQGTDSIHDMRVLNNDAVSYQYKTPEKFLETSECEKKNKYLNTCLNEL